MLESKVPFASARTSAGFGLMRYFIGVALMPTGPTSLSPHSTDGSKGNDIFGQEASPESL